MAKLCSYSAIYNTNAYTTLTTTIWSTQLYQLEHSDGIGHSIDLVVQGFARFVFLGLIPVILCGGILYLLVSCYVYIICDTRSHLPTGDQSDVIQFGGVPTSISGQHGPQPDMDCSTDICTLCIP